jgi:hypothetical protein
MTVMSRWKRGGEHRRPKFSTAARSILLGRFPARLDQRCEAVSDKIDAVVGGTASFVAVLAKAASDMHHVALFRFGDTLGQLAEDRDVVPVGVGFPVVTIAAIIVGSDRDVGDFLFDLDLADAADDAEFCDVLHDALSLSVCRGIS